LAQGGTPVLDFELIVYRCMAARCMAPPSAISKADLLYSLHDEVLELLTGATQVAHAGIAQAARYSKQSGLLSPATCNKLISIDFAYNFIRHLTSIHRREFALELQLELAEYSDAKPASKGVQTEHSMPPSAEVRLLHLNDLVPHCESSEPMPSPVFSPCGFDANREAVNTGYSRCSIPGSCTGSTTIEDEDPAIAHSTELGAYREWDRDIDFDLDSVDGKGCDFEGQNDVKNKRSGQDCWKKTKASTRCSPFFQNRPKGRRNALSRHRRAGRQPGDNPECQGRAGRQPEDDPECRGRAGRRQEDNPAPACPDTRWSRDRPRIRCM